MCRARAGCRMTTTRSVSKGGKEGGSAGCVCCSVKRFVLGPEGDAEGVLQFASVKVGENTVRILRSYFVGIL